MNYSLIWLPRVLANAGLKIALVPGWESRGHGDVGTIQGVICHHTATPAAGNMPTLRTLVHGREDLAGPLSQLGLGRDGTYYIVAAGRCYHAGAGLWQGITDGNRHFIGIEAENTGLKSDSPWPTVQLEAYHRGVAAILQHIGKGAQYCAAHKEYALPRGRKTDPDFDMVPFRSAVANILDGIAPPPALIPAVELGQARRPTLRRGVANSPALVKELQTLIGVPADGNFGAQTEAALRVFQRKHGLVPDGIAGPKTWQFGDQLKAPATAKAVS